MRIGFEAKRLFLNDRGLGNYARNLVYGLLKYHPENDYHLYTPKESNNYINSEFINSNNVTIHKPQGIIDSLSKSAWRSLKLGSISSKDNLNIFHGLSQELPRDIKKSNAKTIVTIHDMIFLKHPEFYKPLDRKIYFNKVKFAVNNADHIVAISTQTKDDLLNNFTISEDKISVIYQSCNEVFYDKRTQEELTTAKNKWGLPEQFILYVGALNDNKNILIILEALNSLKGKVDLPLVIVGKGDAYKKKLVDYAAKHQLTKQLIFASDISDPKPIELSSFYQMASVFIFPSFYEGFGIPILEARFSGAPVIASNSSCLEEAGGQDSMYFDPKDAESLASLIEKSKTLKPSHPKKFKLEDLTKKLINLYRM